ncbi:ankyrin repeat domain-containing protein [Anatilimnocola floriformis]|uniref:ankyrin repeat domain-containing protein n=1 Tax=Anatilimnocola floriformis TaxID=2948575 RepID=UPI0020C2A051|nr:ankyrin repeat domain-containing protein [Anatilimnocola floriformis]
MKITFRVAAHLVSRLTGLRNLVSRLTGLRKRHPSFSDWQFAGDKLETYLSQDLLDGGVSGGTIRCISENRRLFLCVDFWTSDTPNKDLLEKLAEDTRGQLEDGIGEGGFEVACDGEELLLVVEKGARFETVVVDDGEIAPTPSQIAIAARDGATQALSAAIQSAKWDLNAQYQGFPPLSLACLSGHFDAAQLLLQAGADPNATDISNSSPLLNSIFTRNLTDDDSARFAALLLEYGADPAAKAESGDLPHQAARGRDKNRTAQLIEAALHRRSKK